MGVWETILPFFLFIIDDKIFIKMTFGEFQQHYHTLTDFMIKHPAIRANEYASTYVYNDRYTGIVKEDLLEYLKFEVSAVAIIEYIMHQDSSTFNHDLIRVTSENERIYIGVEESLYNQIFDTSIRFTWNRSDITKIFNERYILSDEPTYQYEHQFLQNLKQEQEENERKRVTIL